MAMVLPKTPLYYFVALLRVLIICGAVMVTSTQYIVQFSIRDSSVSFPVFLERFMIQAY
ncbi:hypothetical protein HDU92_007038, partial [Lobulomyces angularis]